MLNLIDILFLFILISGPKFDLAATAALRLADAADAIKTHDLIIVKNDSQQALLPFFGNFCCRLAVQPLCLQEQKSGFRHVKRTYLKSFKESRILFTLE